MKRKNKSSSFQQRKKSKFNHTYEITTQISDLPVEMLISIFKWLNVDDRRAIANVCVHWFDICSSHFSKDNVIVLNNDVDFSESGRLYKTFSTPDRKRKFPNLLIKSSGVFQSEARAFTNLISNEVEHLDIDIFSWEAENIPRNFIQLFRNLRTLKVPSLNNIIDHKFSSTLTSVTLHNPIGLAGIHALQLLRPSGLIGTSLHAKCTLTQLNMNFEEINIISSALKNYCVNFLSGPSLCITFESKLNFLGTDVMCFKDIESLTLFGNIDSFIPLTNFSKLKVLEIYEFFNLNEELEVEHLFGNPIITCPTVKNLKLRSNLNLVNFASLLDCFHNVDHLEIMDDLFTDEHFSLICKKLGNLRTLSIKGLSGLISFESFMNTNKSKYSLKNLQNLETLHIEFDTHYNHTFKRRYEWPNLPKLTTLFLIGCCFKTMAPKYYHQMNTSFPALQSFLIDSSCSSVIPNKMVSILKPWGSTLKQLSLGGYTWKPLTVDEKKTFVNEIAENCRKLKTIYLDGADKSLSISDKCNFFAKIPSLKVIRTTEIDPIENDEILLEMTRVNFLDMKSYLRQNINWYLWDLENTIEYVLNVIMLPEERDFITKTLSSYEFDGGCEMKYSIIFEYLGIPKESISKCLLQECIQLGYYTDYSNSDTD